MRPAPKKGSKTKKFLWGAPVLLLAGTGGWYSLRYAAQFEGTDDAYLDGNLHPVSAHVNGTVAEVRTDELMRKNVSAPSEDDTARANHEVAVANAASARATREAAAAMLRAAKATF